MNAPLVPLGRSAEAAHRAADAMLARQKPLVDAAQRIFTLVAVAPPGSLPAQLERECLKLGALLGGNRPESAEVVNDVGLAARAEAEYKARHGDLAERGEAMAILRGQAYAIEDQEARDIALNELPAGALSLASRYDDRQAEVQHMVEQAEKRAVHSVHVFLDNTPLWKIAAERMHRKLSSLWLRIRGRYDLVDHDEVEP